MFFGFNLSCEVQLRANTQTTAKFCNSQMLVHCIPYILSCVISKE